MQYKQELQARDLHEKLSIAFGASEPATTISITGAVAHWNCTASRGNRMCVIHCLSQTNYAISFKMNDNCEAMGRTFQIEEILASINKWLEGQTVSDLYRTFPFVDRRKRYLKKLWSSAIEEYPELQQDTLIHLDQRHGDFYTLWFYANDRACKIDFYRHDQFPDCEFQWDETKMFSVLADNTIPVSRLLKRWLCDNTMPSELKQEFDWLDIGKLAPYYEANRGVEGEFVLSWDNIEVFHGEWLKLERAPEILRMLQHIREAGFDKTLRAGQSLYTFIVSRSRRHGLRDHQPSIAFEFYKTGRMDVIVKFGNEHKISHPSITYTPDIEMLLKELETHNID